MKKYHLQYYYYVILIQKRVFRRWPMFFSIILLFFFIEITICFKGNKTRDVRRKKKDAIL